MACKKLTTEYYKSLRRSQNANISFSAKKCDIDFGTKDIFVYNAENRLISITPITPVTGDKKLEFSYDYQGRRTSKKVYSWGSSDCFLDAINKDPMNIRPRTVMSHKEKKKR